jgi:hypothetical protein
MGDLTVNMQSYMSKLVAKTIAENTPPAVIKPKPELLVEKAVSLPVLASVPPKKITPAPPAPRKVVVKQVVRAAPIVLVKRVPAQSHKVAAIMETPEIVRPQFFKEANRTASWTDQATGITINGLYQIHDAHGLDQVAVRNIFSKYAEIINSDGASHFVPLKKLQSEIAATVFDPRESSTLIKSDNTNSQSQLDLPSSIVSQTQAR